MIGRHGQGAGDSRSLLSDTADIVRMSTTVATPEKDEACAYCASRIFDHDPICVRDCTEECGTPLYFCHYACLSAYIDANDLVIGDACEWTPDAGGCC
jgi:hypothetical protein